MLFSKISGVMTVWKSVGDEFFELGAAPSKKEPGRGAGIKAEGGDAQRYVCFDDIPHDK